jgi:hypothetical protein
MGLAPFRVDGLMKAFLGGVDGAAAPKPKELMRNNEKLSNLRYIMSPRWYL